MTLANVLSKTTFTGFSDADKAVITGVIRTSYNGSAIAKKMYEDWVGAGKTIDIKKVAGVFQAFLNTGRVEIDLAWLKDYSYITPTGKAVLDLPLGAIVHELGHALGGFRDNVTATDYAGDNVRFSNTMFKQLGLGEQVSYIAYSDTLHKLDYEYTNKQAIDAAKSADNDFSSSALGDSRDLLIGGGSANKLQGGGGNDFLHGAGGGDELNGGEGTDTAVYFGAAIDYDIRRNDDGSWSVRHARGEKNEGADKLINVEKVQFKNGQTYDLRAKGLTFQTDFSFVIDTTGSMGTYIDTVKVQAKSILNALFGSGKIDARVGVVTFRDETIGEPTVVNLAFTEHDKFGDRKAAADAAINAIGVGGGGDLPETAFAGLVKALDGSMGNWRVGAGIHRIALFTDASAKDAHLASTVAALAAKIGGAVGGRSSEAFARGAVDTFTITIPSGDDADRGPDSDGADNSVPNPPLSNEPLKPDATTARLEIYTIFTGPEWEDTSALDAIVKTTGGKSFTTDATGVVDALLEIIKKPVARVIVGTDGQDRLVGGKGDDVISGLGRKDKLFGMAGNDTLDGGDGNDTLAGGLGRDKLRGGKGSDTASYVEASAKVTANLKNSNKNKGEAKGDTYSSVENLKGSKFGDKLIGDGGDNIIKGGKGNDKLTGNKGPDKLIGGGGADNFIFKALSDSTVTTKGRDIVYDFSRKQKDKIDVSGIDAKAGTSKDHKFGFVGTADFSGEKGELRFEKVGKNTFVYGDVNGDGVADFAIHIAKSVDFVKSDFVL